MDKQNLIIYKTEDGKASVALYARDGNVWLSQSQLAELSSTSKLNISMHVCNVLEEKELDKNSVVKDFLKTAADAVAWGMPVGLDVQFFRDRSGQ